MAVFSHFLQKMGVNVFCFFFHSKENIAIVLVFIMYDGN